MSLVNAQFGSREPVVIEGPVLAKCITGRGGHKYVLTLNADSLGRPFRVRVPEEVYRSVHKGDLYRTTMYEGALGIYYRK